MNIEEWFKSITVGESQRSVAEKIGVQQSKLSRQLNAGHLDAEIIRDIARAYGSKAGDELLKTGFLDPDDLTLVGVEEALGMAKNSQLWVEMSKRSDPESRRLYRAEGKPGVIDLDDEVLDEEDAQVFEFPTRNVAPLSDDEIAAAICEANERPQAAHPADDIEYTEPELP
ncbi:hypothetical protein [Corynebacterium glutamicum]|uniref:hypothetical protein n=1 Tax=Corynebacterium glutamicum TaxID=1718 RepID=UPI001B8D9066|nr:hypothetical protein [Corynebacterium glutamicum]